jgi:hypothetical protein
MPISPSVSVVCFYLIKRDGFFFHDASKNKTHAAWACALSGNINAAFHFAFFT